MDRLRIAWFALAAMALLAGPVGCGDDDTGDGDDHDHDSGSPDGGGQAGRSGQDSGTMAGRSGGSGTSGGGAGSGADGGVDGGMTDGGADGGPPPTGCPDVADRDEVLVGGEIDSDTTWTCDKLYIMEDQVFVVDDSVLTIDPGTEIQGDPTTALVITRGSQLISEGTKAQPIVFTSSAGEGMREAGDWGGVILLGSATINVAAGENQIEGLDPTDPRGLYGGDEDDSSCGSVKYTRIDFSGYMLMIDFELQGLTMGGCGSETQVSYLQVHRSNDDGIEIFGGRPNLDHIVLTGNNDDSFDTTEGYVGKVQFMVAQHLAPMPDSGFEFDNQEGAETATPRNAPQIYNVTLVGDPSSKSPGMVLRRGTYGTFGNFIVTGFKTGVDVRDSTTITGTATNPPQLTIKNSLFFDNGGDDGMLHFGEFMTEADNFDEADYFGDASNGNIVDEDPELADPTNPTDPDFVPAEGSPAADAPAPASGFDTSATYMGAFEPGGDDWTAGWTAYPED
jgi:hypothetical protein